MNRRRRYLLTYDIREDRRLRRVHQVARKFGYAVQYSVFVCDLDRAELVLLEQALLGEMHADFDSVLLFDLGETGGRGIECVRRLGRGDAPPPAGGAAIW